MLHSLKIFIFTLVLVCAGWLVSISANATDVVEFYNTNLDNYFITADTNEAIAIDGGSAGPGWTRTGETFKSGGNTPVCRFYGSQSPGPNSHFYTVDTGECQGLKDTQFSANDPRKLTVKSWNFEALDFISTPPTGDQCPVGTMPVYRAYNNGFSRGVDSNHRISINPAAIAQVLGRGWINEGVVMCAESQDVDTQPPATNVTVFTDSGNPLLMSFIPKGGKPTTLFGKKNAEGAATAIDGMYIQETPTSKQLILFDGQGRPSRVTSADGAIMGFYWGSEGQVEVDFVTADGQSHVNFPMAQQIFPLTKPIAQSNPSIINKTASEALTDRFHIWIEAIVHEQGVPVSGATASVKLGSGLFSPPPIPLLERNGSPGLYTAFVENRLSNIPVETLCNTILDASSNFCAFGVPIATYMMEAGCLKIAAEVALIGTPVAGANALLACEVAMLGTLATCSVMPNLPEGTQEGVCKAIDSTVGAIFPDEMIITATAKKHAAEGSASKSITAADTIAKLEIELTCPPPQIARDGKCVNDFELILTKNTRRTIPCEGLGAWGKSCGEADIEVGCKGDGCANEMFTVSKTGTSSHICDQEDAIHGTFNDNFQGRQVKGTAGPIYNYGMRYVREAIVTNKNCVFSWSIEITISAPGGFTKVFKLNS